MKMFLNALLPGLGASLLCASVFAESPIDLQVDATGVAQKILRAQLHVPAQPGPLTLVYPKWIPGEHGPTGPITDMTGLKISANGQTVSWRRDDVDMFAFHLDVPANADAIDVSLDFLLPPSSGLFSEGASSTDKLLDLNWNQVLLYPKGSRPRDLMYSASLLLPGGWRYGTALATSGKRKRMVQFAPVSLETLIDSPVIAGSFFRSVDLSPKTKPGHFLDMVADSADALEITPAERRDYEHLVTESGALFGARHYRNYHFLLTLSDHVAHFGLEHHESSDNREGEKYLTDSDELRRGAYLLCHEMVHSWNGKYRRPAGLATADYQQPMKGELLWVYEGLTDYLGLLLATRSGLWTNGDFREYIALEAAGLDREPGRQWRSLEDTTIAAQLLYESRTEGQAWRRGTDFYQEGDLIWLEVDALIRQLTRGARSLDDFCRKFHGGQSGPPMVIPYTRQDVESALNEIAPYDWRGFFDARIYQAAAPAPSGGIERSGWRLVYTNTVPGLQKLRESAHKNCDMRMSIGLLVDEDGYIADVIPGSPADKAGIGNSMKLVAVNDRRWTPDILRADVSAATNNSAPIELLVENEDYFHVFKLDYHEGEKYPELARDSAKADLLSEILKPLTPAPKD